jgi:hypothetical protein
VKEYNLLFFVGDLGVVPGEGSSLFWAR